MKAKENINTDLTGGVTHNDFANSQTVLKSLYERILNQKNKNDYESLSDDEILIDKQNQKIQRDYPQFKTEYSKNSKNNLCLKDKKNNKKMMTDYDKSIDIDEIKKENEFLRYQLTKCEKKIALLQSHEEEVEYMKKVCLLQNNQIQKLRKVIRNLRKNEAQNVVARRKSQSLHEIYNYGRSNSYFKQNKMSVDIDSQLKIHSNCNNSTKFQKTKSKIGRPQTHHQSFCTENINELKGKLPQNGKYDKRRRRV